MEHIKGANGEGIRRGFPWEICFYPGPDKLSHIEGFLQKSAHPWSCDDNRKPENLLFLPLPGV